MLTFSLFGVPVRVHLSFLIIALFGLGRYTGLDIAGWTIGVFVAVLLHESGHAFTARAFGAHPVTITLFALGGYTTWPVGRQIGPGKRFLISAAGSAMGIAVGGTLLAAWRQDVFADFPSVALAGIESFILAGLFWGVLNWIPILPLDGGHMVQSLLELVWPSSATKVTRVVSVIAGTVAIFVAIRLQEPILALFVGLIMVTGLSASARPRRPERAAQPDVDAASSESGADEPAEVERPPDRAEPPEFPI